MSIAIALFLLQAQTADTKLADLIAAIARSGRVLEIGERARRLTPPGNEIAPGAPPLLSFRYFEGADRHRFGNLDVILDDAGH